MEKMCASFTLEIKIRYAEGLKTGKKLIRKNAFVTVSTDNQVYGQSQVSTRLCEDCETYPTWDEKLTTTMPLDTKSILLDVRHKTKSKEKSIAISKVPVSDFVNGYLPQNYMHFLSYRLKDCHGEPNGIINFCVKVIGKFGPQYDQNYKSSEIHGYKRATFVPKPLNVTSNMHGIKDCNEVVVGVPAEWSNSWHR